MTATIAVPTDNSVREVDSDRYPLLAHISAPDDLRKLALTSCRRCAAKYVISL